MDSTRTAGLYCAVLDAEDLATIRAWVEAKKKVLQTS
jgi:hypothetical protein